MVKREALALALVVTVAVLLPALLLGYQVARGAQFEGRVVDLAASTAAAGGWRPDVIRVERGERVRLRISATDVVHGFAVPGLGIEVDEVAPGRVVEVEFVAERAGRYAFACTRWCSPDHWRMRGTIEVAGVEGEAKSPPRPKPLYQELGLDPDAMRSAPNPPSAPPSAERGESLGRNLASDLRSTDWLRRNAPSEAFALLRAEPANADLSDDEVWSLVALAWQATPAATLARGEQLYRRDCAACHGELGRGDGPAGRRLPGMALFHDDARRGPADFADASRMLAASEALLQGKILRGGMGTGMPEWGSLYSGDDLWAVLAYLRTFVFEYDR